MGDENKLSVITKLTFFGLNKSRHRVVELTGIRPVKDGSTCLTETQCRVPFIWGLWSGQVPCHGDALGMVWKKPVDFYIKQQCD